MTVRGHREVEAGIARGACLYGKGVKSLKELARFREHRNGHAVATGRLPDETVSTVEIRGIPPTLAVRDRLRDAQADQILVKSGAMSVQTLALRHGLDPEHEQQLLAGKATTS